MKPARLLAMVVAATAAILIPTAGSAAGWPTYHGDNSRSGLDSADPSYTGVQNAWSAALDGYQYASPLVVGSTVIAATEQDSVYAYSTSGVQLWRTNLGPPVPSSSLPCGDVNPVGITSTPVADPATNTVFVVALLNSPIHYVLFALDIASGAVRWQESLTDTAQNFNPAYQNQRGALTLSGGNIYVPFGGRAGDCPTYYGWVMSFPESDSGSLTSVKLPEGNDDQGGLWQPAGASVDGSGNLYYASGNTSCSSSTCTYDYGESVIKFSPALVILDEFHPANWYALNGSDTDLGSTGPLQLPGGVVFQVGKSGDGYLLSESSLGGSGHTTPLYTAHVCPNETQDSAYGGDAFDGSRIYVPCTLGVVALTYNQAQQTFTFDWQAGGVYNPPIVAGGYVWVDAGGYLYGLNPATGATAFKVTLGSGSSHFGTPAAFDNQLFVPAGPSLVAVDAVAPFWHVVSGAANDVAAGGGQVFVLGVDSQPGGHGIYHWTGSGWVPLSGGAVSIAVDATGRPWVTNDSNQIFRWAGSGWLPVPGSAHYVAAGGDGSVYALGTNTTSDGDGIWRWTGSGWTGLDGWLTDLAVGQDGTLWGANAHQAIFRRMPGAGWVQMPGSAGDVTAKSAAAAWAAGTNAVPGGDGVWAWNGGTWIALSGGVVDLAVDTSSGTLWGVNSGQSIYYYSG